VGCIIEASLRAAFMKAGRRGRRLEGALALAFAASAACARPSASEAPLASLQEARELPEGRAIRVRGVLGAYDPASHGGYLQDGQAALFVDTALASSVPTAGGGVEVEGIVERRREATFLRARSFRIAAAAPTPEPQPIAVAALADAAVQGRWVSVDGVVTGIAERGRGHVLQISSGGQSLRACVAEGPPDRPEGRDSILGFEVRAVGVRVSPADDEAAAGGCTLRLPTRVFLRFLRDTPVTRAPAASGLTTIDAIRDLSPEEARQRRPVRVRGVVTAHDRDENLLFVQDRTAGIYIEAWRHLHDVRPGELVEVTGWTGGGAFAPIIEWPQLVHVGTAPFPTAIRLGAAIQPQYDSQWIEVDGIVRAAGLRTRRAVLDLMAFGDRLEVHLPGITDLERVRPLVDAEVRVRGVYRATFSPTRQLTGALVEVPSLDLVSVLAAAPEDPYGAPLRRSDTILEFHPRDATGRRVHVRGVVTLQRPGRFFYVRDAGGPLRVESREAAPLRPGDEVDVVGFPGLGDFRPVLRDASYRRRAHTTPRDPSPVHADQALSGRLDGELITIEGRLLERLSPEGESRLVLQSPLSVFEAVLADVSAPFDDLRADSRLRVTGICVVRADSARVPQSFQVLLRDVDDVRVVEAAPWWTRRRAALAGASLLAVALGALLWVGTLRRRVRAQTEILRGRLAREASLEERTRLARELHDTLEQNLAGIGYALEAVKHTIDHPSVARSHLDRALAHVDQSMGEARRSVWAVRPRPLEEGDLVSALETLAREVSWGGVARVDVHVQGDRWPLLPGVEDQLFRVAQEALTNALKHARSTRLRVDLHFEEGALQILVHDDGRGFDAAAPVGSGHLGLIGMRERVAKVGGVLDLESGPDHGTTVRVAVPRSVAALPQVS
jgi:signal transduction histidine kinase